METIGLAFLTALGFFIILWKMGIHRFLRFHWQTDLAVTALLSFLFFGTLGGMLIGLLAALFFSLMLSITKRLLNY